MTVFQQCAALTNPTGVFPVAKTTISSPYFAQMGRCHICRRLIISCLCGDMCKRYVPSLYTYISHAYNLSSTLYIA